jgi:hypothetical protein
VYEPVPILIPVKAATSLRVIDSSTADRLGPIVKGVVNLLNEKDGEELGEVVSLLLDLYTKFPRSLKPVSELLDSLVQFVLVAAKKSVPSKEEDDSDDDDDMIRAMPNVAQLVIDIYRTDETADVIPSLLQPLVALLPFADEPRQNAGILDGLVQLLEDTPRFGCIVQPGASLLAEILTLPKAELDLFELDDDLVARMKTTLKTIVRGNKKLDFKLKALFKKSNARKNQYLAIIK